MEPGSADAPTEHDVVYRTWTSSRAFRGFARLFVFALGCGIPAYMIIGLVTPMPDDGLAVLVMAPIVAATAGAAYVQLLHPRIDATPSGSSSSGCCPPNTFPMTTSSG